MTEHSGSSDRGHIRDSAATASQHSQESGLGGQLRTLLNVELRHARRDEHLLGHLVLFAGLHDDAEVVDEEAKRLAQAGHGHAREVAEAVHVHVCERRRRRNSVRVRKVRELGSSWA